ncbi:GNAT family N-acetyltransferase [Saccharospirillum salsuginis]|uniref:GNAT family N-acetyltransferase n=1 Tax=Saccharospirillum salsuginis TaxID=418750 RepID=A0A918KHL4_9GAMM|nr:GNAT family N-acetyltransferase [Saccharospirillum salsuginis]GGX63895.1 GNAT family N-acetyltransferase [Saccharospirillum salsuginis]
MIEYRKAQIEEIDALKKLLWEYGPNEWNYLTHEGVNEEFSLVASGNAQAIVATHGSNIIGFAVLIDGIFSPNYIEKYYSLNDIQFVGDVVVSSMYSGKGIATKLLEECLAVAKSKKLSAVLIERHEENLASAGMMRKARFKIVDTFHDPAKRSTGSQNSVILEYELQ